MYEVGGDTPKPKGMREPRQLALAPVDALIKGIKKQIYGPIYQKPSRSLKALV